MYVYENKREAMFISCFYVYVGLCFMSISISIGVQVCVNNFCALASTCSYVCVYVSSYVFVHSIFKSMYVRVNLYVFTCVSILVFLSGSMCVYQHECVVKGILGECIYAFCVSVYLYVCVAVSFNVYVSFSVCLCVYVCIHV